MKKQIVDEKPGIPYALVVDFYLPWGDLPDDESEYKPIGIWGCGSPVETFAKQKHRPSRQAIPATFAVYQATQAIAIY